MVEEADSDSGLVDFPLGVSATGASPDPDRRGWRDILSPDDFSTEPSSLRNSLVGEEGLDGVGGEVGDLRISCRQ